MIEYVSRQTRDADLPAIVDVESLLNWFAFREVSFWQWELKK